MEGRISRVSRLVLPGLDGGEGCLRLAWLRLEMPLVHLLKVGSIFRFHRLQLNYLVRLPLIASFHALDALCALLASESAAEVAAVFVMLLQRRPFCTFALGTGVLQHARGVF